MRNTKPDAQPAKDNKTQKPSTERSSRTPSIRDVANAADVGLGTVSRVLNDSPGVSAKTKRKVLQAIDELGYVPDIVAQSMRNRRSMTFACMVRDFTGPVLSTFVDAMQVEIDSAGFSLIVASSYHDTKRELALLRGLQQRRIDGLVIASSSETHPELTQLLQSFGAPVVLLDRDRPNDVDAVLINHGSGLTLAMEYLAALGHRKIGLMSGEPDLRPTRRRMDAYTSGLKTHGIAFNPALVKNESFSPESGYQQACELLSSPDRPTAILAGGTTLLNGLLRAVRERGLRIPADISIISCADSDLAQLLEPGITTVRWNHDQLGKMAGKLLIERLRNPQRELQRLTFDSELILRGSCAAPAHTD